MVFRDEFSAGHLSEDAFGPEHLGKRYHCIKQILLFILCYHHGPEMSFQNGLVDGVPIGPGPSVELSLWPPALNCFCRYRYFNGYDIFWMSIYSAQQSPGT
jgi:hypothetical protein